MSGFDAFLGNELLKEKLTRAMEEDRASHAYLIAGEPGTGKWTLALLLAQALRCTGWGEPPCGACPNCRAFAAGRLLPDVIFVEPGLNAKKEPKKTIGVEEVRDQILTPLSLRPDGPGKKVFLVRQGQSLTPAAQNALLKALEEPPAYAVFLVLTTSLDAILPTVQSRMVVLQTQALPPGLMAAELERRAGVSPGDAVHLAAAARGSLGRALELAADPDFARLQEDVNRWLEVLERGDTLAAMGLAEEMQVYQARQGGFLDGFLLWYRDLLAWKLTGDPEMLLDKSRWEAVEAAARQETVQGLFAKLDAVRETQRQLAANANFTLALETMLLNIKENCP